MISVARYGNMPGRTPVNQQVLGVYKTNSSCRKWQLIYKLTGNDRILCQASFFQNDSGSNDYPKSPKGKSRSTF